MSQLQLPHKIVDYTCPTNGIEDQYEWKTGQRLPDYLLLYLSMIGFSYIRQKLAPAPRMVFWGSVTGARQHEFLADILGYQWQMAEGSGFQPTLKKVKESVDRGIPPILGLLDTYHLPYFPHFYHKVHIPQHYVLMVGYDDERGGILVQDNSREDVQLIPYTDLKQAWDVHNPGQGIKNTCFMLEFGEHIASIDEIIQQGLKKRAGLFLSPENGFTGIAGMRKICRDFPKWEQELTLDQFRASLTHLVTYTSSVVPLLPQKMLPYPLAVPDPHQACRDQWAKILETLGQQYQMAKWINAAGYFRTSGHHIQAITDIIVDDLLNNRNHLNTAIPEHLEQLIAAEETGFTLLQ